MPEEDFDLMSLAEFLHLHPDQVRRMTDRGRLPGRRIGGEWRFSRAEIHQWFEEKIGASGERELDEVDRVLDLQDKKQPLNRSKSPICCSQTAFLCRLWPRQNGR